MTAATGPEDESLLERLAKGRFKAWLIVAVGASAVVSVIAAVGELVN